MGQQNVILILEVVLFMAMMLYLGAVTTKWVTSSTEYIGGGREANWFMFMTGLTAMILAGTTFEAAPSLGYIFGLPAMWFMIAWSLVMVIFGFVAVFIRRSGAYSLAEWLEVVYGKNVKLVFAVVGFMGGIFGAFPQFIGAANILSGATGMSYALGVILIGAVTMIYLVGAGLWSLYMTTVVQWFFMFIVMLIMVPVFIYLEFGPSLLNFLIAGPNPIPPENFTLIGNMKVLAVTLPSILTFFILWLGVAVPNQAYWIKSSSIRTEREIIKGCVYTVFFTIPFAIALPLFGMFARAEFGKVVPTQALGKLMSIMPSFLYGLVFVAVLSAVMSTAAGAMIAANAYFARDIYRAVKPSSSQKELLVVNRLMMFVIGILSIILAAFYPRSAMYAIGVLSATLMPVLVSLLASIFTRKLATKEAALASIFLTVPFGLYWEISGRLSQMHTSVFTLISALSIYVVVSIIVKITGPWWGKRAVAS